MTFGVSLSSLRLLLKWRVNLQCQSFTLIASISHKFGHGYRMQLSCIVERYYCVGRAIAYGLPNNLKCIVYFSSLFSCFSFFLCCIRLATLPIKQLSFPSFSLPPHQPKRNKGKVKDISYFHPNNTSVKLNLFADREAMQLYLT